MSGNEITLDPDNTTQVFMPLEEGVKKKTVCRNCWGMKVIELVGGDTKDCRGCGGKGFE